MFCGSISIIFYFTHIFKIMKTIVAFIARNLRVDCNSHPYFDFFDFISKRAEIMAYSALTGQKKPARDWENLTLGRGDRLGVLKLIQRIRRCLSGADVCGCDLPRPIICRVKFLNQPTMPADSSVSGGPKASSPITSACGYSSTAAGDGVSTGSTTLCAARRTGSRCRVRHLLMASSGISAPPSRIAWTCSRPTRRYSIMFMRVRSAKARRLITHTSPSAHQSAWISLISVAVLGISFASLCAPDLVGGLLPGQTTLDTPTIR